MIQGGGDCFASINSELSMCVALAETRISRRDLDNVGLRRK